MMQIEFLIIGQGLSGTFLSWFLQQRKKSFLVMDNNHPHAASRTAAGIINPVTGRRIVKTWMIDELIPFVKNTYTEFGNQLELNAITEKKIIDFFPTPQMKITFSEKVNEDPFYLHFEQLQELKEFFNYEFGYGVISPAFLIHIEIILPAWRKQLKGTGNLLEEDFELADLQIQNSKIVYKNLEADKIIFCNGTGSFNYPFFQNLPYALNKGEALIIESNELPATHIYKKGIILSPMQEKGLFWAGTNYLWEYRDESPSNEFREQAERQLKGWLKVPFKIREQKASIRPATIERRPFVGIHPNYPQVAILNGMGTKGCSLAPFFAKQLADHLLDGKKILSETDINRFSKILTSNNI